VNKIGILTYLKEYANLGTNMQAYCTLKAVQNVYPDAEVELVNYAERKPVLKPYLSGMSPRSLIYDYARIREYDAFFRNEIVLGKNKLISSNCRESIQFIRQHNYHTIYVGSDTVLNLQRAEKDCLTAYWLDPGIDSKKVLLAASSHNTVHGDLSERQRKLIQETIDSFSLLGVRDDATFRLLLNFTSSADDRLQIVPDPTFTFEIKYDFIDAYVEKKKLRFDKPVVCLHLLRDTKWARDLAMYFRKAGFAIASLRPAHYADMIFTDLSPFEQMGLYKYFDLVISHRFHDAVFCFKNNTPVIAFPQNVSDVTSYGESKHQSLFKSFGLAEPNYIPNKDGITAEYLFDIHQDAIARFKSNKQAISNRLREHREKYEGFLRGSKTVCMSQS
jgi:hypothetical protein